MPADGFTFLGFPPSKAGANGLAGRDWRRTAAIVLFEAPHRIVDTPEGRGLAYWATGTWPLHVS